MRFRWFSWFRDVTKARVNGEENKSEWCVVVLILFTL